LEALLKSDDPHIEWPLLIKGQIARLKKPADGKTPRLISGYGDTDEDPLKMVGRENLTTEHGSKA